MKRVSVALCGGLGNQCFQFLTMLAYAIKTKRSIVISEESKGMRKQVYWQTIFAILEKKMLPAIDLLYAEHEYLEKTKQFVPLKEAHFAYAPLVEMKETEDVMLFGYFQSHLYFQEIEHLIPSIFSLHAARYEHLNKMWQEIVLPQKSSEKVYASMHIRRGDYLNFPQIHPTLSTDYYTTAMSIFPKNTIFVVFSDDYEWCRQTWSTENNIIFAPKTLSDIDTFHFMMYFCLQGHIIANSSFSWWAAYVDWLNSGKKQIVVAPETWFGPKGPQTHSLHVPGWIIVQDKT